MNKRGFSRKLRLEQCEQRQLLSVVGPVHDFTIYARDLDGNVAAYPEQMVGHGRVFFNNDPQTDRPAVYWENVGTDGQVEVVGGMSPIDLDAVGIAGYWGPSQIDARYLHGINSLYIWGGYVDNLVLGSLTATNFIMAEGSITTVVGGGQADQFWSQPWTWSVMYGRDGKNNAQQDVYHGGAGGNTFLTEPGDIIERGTERDVVSSWAPSDPAGLTWDAGTGTLTVDKIVNPNLRVLQLTTNGYNVSWGNVPQDEDQFWNVQNYRLIDNTPVVPVVPTLDWALAPVLYGTALGPEQKTATANVDGTFSYSFTDGEIPTAGHHLLTANFTPADTVHYTTASMMADLTVQQATPTVTWNQPTPIGYGTALSAAQLNAQASVPGSFVYSTAAGVLLDAGTYTVTASFTPSDTVDYTTATTSVSLQVNQATPTVNWNNPADIDSGTALGPAQLNATASVNGEFVYTPAAGTVLNVGAGQQLSTLFVPANGNFSSVTKTVTINVKQTIPVMPTLPNGWSLTNGPNGPDFVVDLQTTPATLTWDGKYPHLARNAYPQGWTFSNLHSLTILGTDGPDVINASVADYILAIDGRGGDDILTGGKGQSNTLIGGPGVDTLIHGDGPCVLDARDGFYGDHLQWRQGVDTVLRDDAPTGLPTLVEEQNGWLIVQGSALDLEPATAPAPGMIAMTVTNDGIPVGSVIVVTTPVEVRGPTLVINTDLLTEIQTAYGFTFTPTYGGDPDPNLG
jgi:hypothetical protein